MIWILACTVSPGPDGSGLVTIDPEAVDLKVGRADAGCGTGASVMVPATVPITLTAEASVEVAPVNEWTEDWSSLDAGPSMWLSQGPIVLAAGAGFTYAGELVWIGPGADCLPVGDYDTVIEWTVTECLEDADTVADYGTCTPALKSEIATVDVHLGVVE